MTSDVIAFTVAFLIADHFHNGGSRSLRDVLVFAILIPVWVLGASAAGLYDRDERRPDYTTLDDAGPAFTFITIWTWLGLAVASVVGAIDVTVNEALVFGGSRSGSCSAAAR